METRLDKFLSDNTKYSRSELKNFIRQGKVTVDGKTTQKPEEKINPDANTVRISGVTVRPIGLRTVMMHKPKGYVTSTEDPRDPTVMELLPEDYRFWGLNPIGRLDKDTEGLLLFTNNGDLLHRLTSPKYEVEKCYYAEHEGRVTEEDISAFAEGLMLKDGLLCKPARLQVLEEGKALVYVKEGKYHQVRRMMAARGHFVHYLKRISEGAISLGELKPGEVRELTEEESEALRQF